MSGSGLLLEGFYLMVFGMGFVFMFLIILVYAVKLMSYLVIRFTPEPVIETKSAVKSEISSQSVENEHIKAVLAAAIHHHRRVRGLKA